METLIIVREPPITETKRIDDGGLGDMKRDLKENKYNLVVVGLTLLIAGGFISVDLFLLGFAAFFQNMMFTLVSRSRNSGDPNYHMWCAFGSNGIWFICQVLIVKNIWASIHNGEWRYVMAAFVVYTICTVMGSVFMMRRLLRTETGKRRVGARSNSE